MQLKDLNKGLVEKVDKFIDKTSVEELKELVVFIMNHLYDRGLAEGRRLDERDDEQNDDDSPTSPLCIRT